MCLISTRDCFAFDLIVRKSIVDFEVPYLVQPSQSTSKSDNTSSGFHTDEQKGDEDLNNDIWCTDSDSRNSYVDSEPFKLKLDQPHSKFALPKFDTGKKVSPSTEAVLKKLMRRQVIKREFFFDPDNLPENYELFIDDEIKKLFKKHPEERSNPYNFPVGVTTYENFYSN